MSALRAMAEAGGREATSGVRGGGRLGIWGRPLPAETPRIGRFHFSFWVMPSYLPRTTRHRALQLPCCGPVDMLLHKTQMTCQIPDRPHSSGKCCCDHMLHVFRHPNAGRICPTPSCTIHWSQIPVCACCKTTVMKWAGRTSPDPGGRG